MTMINTFHKKSADAAAAKRFRNIGSRWIGPVLCGLLGLSFPHAAVAEGATMSPRTIARNHVINRRQNAAERRQENKLRSFRSEEGVPTLTNRGAKYKSRDGFTEVKIDLRPIVILPEWRKPQKAQRTYGSEDIRKIVNDYAQHYRLDENLVNAVIQVESNWNPNAVSTAGACGLMQLMPGTANDMGVSDIFDPTENISGGTQYLARMLEMFDNDTTLALAAYNAGPGNVMKYGGVPPFNETQKYVVKVQELAGGGGTISPRRYSVFSRKNSGEARGSYASKSTGSSRDEPTRSAPAQPSQGAHLFLVQFHSGLTQPADKVLDKDPYYFIEYGRRSYSVRKDLVKEIVKRSV